MEDDLIEKAQAFIDRPSKTRRLNKDADVFKTVDEVFDHRTLIFLNQLISKHIIDTMVSPISTGKEANTFIATEPTGSRVVVKIYRTSTSTFRALSKYIDGDPRFVNIRQGHSDIIYTWCRKEYQNLLRMKEAGLSVPEPIHHYKNILVMELVPYNGMPALPLKECSLDEKEAREVYDILIDFVRRAFKDAGLVHSDLSEYNVLLGDDGPVIIDVGQSVLVDHPSSDKFLYRDLANVTRYFKGLGNIRTPEELFHEITGR